MDVTAYISTKNRTGTTLSLAIASLINQTVRPKKIILFDDNDSPVDLREKEPYMQLFHLCDVVGIQWQVIFGQKRGQIHNHKKAIEIIDTPLIWRVDDDNYCESDVLETLLKNMDLNVGAIGSCIFNPNVDIEEYSDKYSSMLKDIFHKPNAQWSKFTGIKEVDHLHNSFLFRKSAVNDFTFPDLSPVGHREESIFSHEIKRKGYKVLICGDCITWHLKADGGIRSYNNSALYDHDEKIFRKKMIEWNIEDSNKMIVLNCGLGDTYAFKNILNKLKSKNKKLTLAVCYPEVFEGDDVDLISIADSKNILGERVEDHNIYKFMIDRNWKKTLIEAFEEMYLK